MAVLKEGTVVTDVGSTKTSIHETVAALGLESCSSADTRWLARKRPATRVQPTICWKMRTISLPRRRTRRLPTLTVWWMWQNAIGALPLVLDYHRHDFIVAAISHLPHLIASSLVNLVHDCDSEDQMMKRLAAGGFKDITRIASSSPVMWEQICMTNTGNITEVLDRYIDSLTTLREELSDHQSRAIYPAV